MLITSWRRSTDIDIFSPQLYTSGFEATPEFTLTPCRSGGAWESSECTWERLKPIKARWVLSLASEDHYPAAHAFFLKLGIRVSGFIQWKDPVKQEADPRFKRLMGNNGTNIIKTKKAAAGVVKVGTAGVRAVRAAVPTAAVPTAAVPLAAVPTVAVPTVAETVAETTQQQQQAAEAVAVATAAEAVAVAARAAAKAAVARAEARGAAGPVNPSETPAEVAIRQALARQASKKNPTNGRTL